MERMKRDAVAAYAYCLERGDAKGHNAILDVLAFDGNNKQYNLEIQIKPNDNLLQRARYYGAITDTEKLREGVDYKQLSELYIAFVTRTDYFKQEKPVYTFETRCEDLPKSIHTGIHITFVNGACIDDSPLGKLMHDMECADPDKMYYKELGERCAFLKRTPQERLMMSGIWAEAIEQGIEIGKAQGIDQGKNTIVMRLIRESGLSDENIVQYTGFSPEAVRELRKAVEAENKAKTRDGDLQ